MMALALSMLLAGKRALPPETPMELCLRDAKLSYRACVMREEEQQAQEGNHHTVRVRPNCEAERDRRLDNCAAFMGPPEATK